MKILLIGDIHFKDTSSIPQFNKLTKDGIPVELDRAVKSIQWVNQVIEKKKPNLVIQLGDVFHSLNQISSLVLIEAHRSIKSLYNTCKFINAELIIIGGNHDIYREGKYTAEVLPCDYFVSETIEINDFTFIPYKEPEYDMWQDIINAKTEYIFTHTQVKGVSYSKLRKSETGLDVSLLQNFVFSGHIHIPQQIGNVYYTGSLYQNIPSEQPINDMPFGVTLLDTETKDVAQIENNAVQKLKTIYVETINDIPKDIEMYKDYLLKVVSSDKDVIKYFEDNKFDFYVVPFPKQKKEVEYEIIKDVEYKPPQEIMTEYLLHKDMTLVDYLSKYIRGER